MAQASHFFKDGILDVDVSRAACFSGNAFHLDHGRDVPWSRLAAGEQFGNVLRHDLSLAVGIRHLGQ
jgi:hypothetical protein